MKPPGPTPVAPEKWPFWLSIQSRGSCAFSLPVPMRIDNSEPDACSAETPALESRPAHLTYSRRGSSVMKDSQGDPRGGLSRRGFLTGTGAAAAAAAGLTAELAPATTAQPAAAPGYGPAPVTIQLSVNGQQMTTSIE